MDHPIYIIFLLLLCAALYLRTRALEERLSAMDRALIAERAVQVVSAHVQEFAKNDLRVHTAGF